MLAYAVTIFTGAFLLFQVQPLIGKYILPWFGGGPGVWTTCMLFFQVLLLGGYAYAHFTSRWLRPRAQALVHLTLLAAALALLPITPSDSWKPTDASNPTLHILALLAVSIGLPYFVLSATGPLVQQWFSRSRPKASPYRLYALSNVGSLLALLSYPFYFETHFPRQIQASMWAWGLVAYAVCCGWCAVRMWKSEGRVAKAEDRNPKTERRPKSEDRSPKAVGTQVPQPAEPKSEAAEGGTGANDSDFGLRPSFGFRPSAFGLLSSSALDYLLWLLLPACASVLLLATTNKICQDVAVIPFLWVLPLAIYLLSFIIAFDSPRWYTRWLFAPALALALGVLCWVLFQKIQGFGGFVIGLFVCCMVCHGELYRLKPDPAHLTAYYLMIAAGGALGGVFVAVVAPLVFTDYFELHWGLWLCGLLFLVVCARSIIVAADGSRRTAAQGGKSAPTAVGGYRGLRWAGCGLWAAGMVALTVGLWAQAHDYSEVRSYRARNFYGVLTLYKHVKPDMSFVELMHGKTEHGLQFLDPVRAAWPTAYFCERSGGGIAMSMLPAGHRRVGLVGLGAGTLAAYGQPGDTFRFYEINPDVYRLATNHFTYLSNCKAKWDVVLGDARLSLEREPAQNFDLLVLDAFSSDAIPVHLLTEQAFELYQRHVKTNGLIAVHISNGYLNLEPVIANLARRFGYELAVIEYVGNVNEWWNQNSTWALLSHNSELIDSPTVREAARPVHGVAKAVPLWTDDFAGLFQIIRWGAVPLAAAQPAQQEAEVAARFLERGDYAGAAERYRRALQINPYEAEILNNLAWLLATCPDGSVRNGAEAVQHAELACTLTEYRRTVLVGTLAAAYAEAGRFTNAIASAEQACELASMFKEDALLARNRELLELYRAGKAYHERGR